MSRDSKKSFLVGAIFGGIVGSLTALLFAPKSGAKLRKDISKKYQDVSEKTQDLIYGVTDHAKHLVEKAKEIAEEAKDAVQNIAKEMKDR